MKSRTLLVMIIALATSSMTAAFAQNIPDTMSSRVAPCIACHGVEGRATRDGYFPRIAGKPATYLYNQLINFRDGRRQFPSMTYMVANLSDAYLREIADYFSTLQAPYPPPPVSDQPPAVLERGRLLTQRGDAGKKIPACVACHGNRLTGVAPSIPALVGLPRDYLNAQFGAWKNGARHAAAPDCMSTIASAISVEDISAVAAWLSAQPMPADSKPDVRLTAPLPLSCGSVAEGAR